MNSVGGSDKNMKRENGEGCLIAWLWGFGTFIIGMIVCYFCIKYGWIIVR